MKMSGANVQFLFTLQHQLKLHHWQTHSFSTHKAIDEILKDLDGHIDTYVETYMGKYGRPTLTRTTCDVRLKNLSQKSVVTFVKGCIVYLQEKFMKGLGDKDSALFNIRDEMIGNLQQLLYLFSLHG